MYNNTKYVPFRARNQFTGSVRRPSLHHTARVSSYYSNRCAVYLWLAASPQSVLCSASRMQERISRVELQSLFAFRFFVGEKFQRTCKWCKSFVRISVLYSGTVCRKLCSRFNDYSVYDFNVIEVIKRIFFEWWRTDNHGCGQYYCCRNSRFDVIRRRPKRDLIVIAFDDISVSAWNYEGDDRYRSKWKVLRSSRVHKTIGAQLRRRC